MPQPALIITGASGFVGRHLLEELKRDYRIFALARRSQRECGAPVDDNIAWMQVDIGDRERLERTFREISSAGGSRILIHLAAYYDFAGENRPEYRRTNVEGTRNVLEVARGLGLERFVLASSVAACAFPRREGAVTEATPPDGKHIYAWSKREAEQQLRAFRDQVPGCVVRFGAVFSDWCEYPPLYMFLNTWLSSSWRARILGGRGESAIPYVHVRDVVAFFRRLLVRIDRLENGETLIVSTEGGISHRELYEAATRCRFGRARQPIFVPKPLCGLGILGMNLLGRLTSRMPFERPWMARYIDHRLEVDNSYTRNRLGWTPTARYRLDRRMPYLIEHLRSEPFQWHARNEFAMRRAPARPDLRIYNAMARVEDLVVSDVVTAILEERTRPELPRFKALDRDELAWRIRLYFRLLLTSVQNADRMQIANYMGITSRSRFRAGFTGEELRAMLDLFNGIVLYNLASRAECAESESEVYQRITIPIEFAKDEVREQYARFLEGVEDEELAPPGEAPAEPPLAGRQALEETIWSLLVHRK